MKKTTISDISLEDLFKYCSTLNKNLGKTQNPTAEECFANYNFDFYQIDFDFDITEWSFEKLDKHITCVEIEHVVIKLKKNKSYDSDILLNEYFFIESIDILSSHLLDIFNCIFNSGYFPDNWC